MSRIKILEYTSFLRIRLQRLLDHYGFDKTEVLESLINMNARYTFKDSDLVILDLDNRNIDVVSIIEELKKNPETSQIAIILLSSQSDIKTLKRAIKAGCTEFVTKPFSDELLIQKIHKLTRTKYKNLGIPTDIVTSQDTNSTSFTWQKDYEIGIEEIDIEHKAIIDNYEKLYNYMKNGKGHEYYKEIVGFLEEYIEGHFTHEEAFQERIGYDQRLEHEKYHSEFKEKIEQIIATHSEREVTNLDLVKINLFLKDWLLHHILVEDAKIGEFFEKIGKPV